MPNTSTDTGSDVIHSNKKYISTTGKYKVAFSLWPSTAVARLQSSVCERRGLSKNLALKACYVRPWTAAMDVMRDDRKTRVTTITRALRPLWECYLTKQTRRVGQKWTANCGNGESREVQAWCTRWLVAWLSGRTSVFSRHTFSVLRSTCSWWVTTYEGKPSAMGQPTRPSQPFIPSASIDE